MDYPLLYLEGIVHFNRGDWFESHDSWEELWHETTGQPRDFLQGLIQIAIGLCHYYNRNTAGAVSLYGRAMPRLRSYDSPYWGLDLDRLTSELETCFLPALTAIDANPEASIPMETSAPLLQLDPPPQSWPSVGPSRTP